MPLEPGRRVHFWLRRITLRCILSLCGAPERRFGRPTRWTNKAQRVDNAGMMRLGRPSPPRMAILPSERPGRACGEGPWFSVLIAFARISFMGVRVAPCHIALHGSMGRRRSRLGQTKPNMLISRYLLDCDERFVCALCLPLEAPCRSRHTGSSNGGLLQKKSDGHTSLHLDVRPPSFPRKITLPRLFGGPGVRIGGSGLFSGRSARASPCDWSRYDPQSPSISPPCLTLGVSARTLGAWK